MVAQSNQADISFVDPGYFATYGTSNGSNFEIVWMICNQCAVAYKRKCGRNAQKTNKSKINFCDNDNTSQSEVPTQPKLYVLSAALSDDRNIAARTEKRNQN